LLSAAPSTLRRRATPLALLLLALAYLALLQWRASAARAPVLVFYLGPTPSAPARNEETGLWTWATPEQVRARLEEGLEAGRSRARITRALRTEAPEGLRVEVTTHGETRLLLVELPASGPLDAFLGEVRAADADLVVVATLRDPAEITAEVEGSVLLLPGRHHPGLGGEPESEGRNRLVAPWVDGRHRLGQVEILLDPETGPAFRARGMDLALEKAPADAPTTLGFGPPELFHDGVRFSQQGLARALARVARDATGAEVSLLNYLSVRADLVGLVDAARLRRALPFHNQIVLLTLDGDRLQRLLDENEPMDTRYLVVDGLDADPDGTWRHEDGSPLDAGHPYRVATLDYLANGARGRRPIFLEGREFLRTGLFTDRLALDLLIPTPPAEPAP
jgi:hypothetical protein